MYPSPRYARDSRTKGMQASIGVDARGRERNECERRGRTRVTKRHKKQTCNTAWYNMTAWYKKADM